MSSWTQSPLERLQATLWQAGVEVAERRGSSEVVLRLPRRPLHRVAVAERNGVFEWAGERHPHADVAGAARRILVYLCET